MNKARELALLLLRKAAEDEAAIAAWAESSHVPDSVFGFHCQQAAEKLLKAVLASRRIYFRRTHQLRELMDLLADHDLHLPEELSELDVFTPYGTEFRYEDVPVGREEPLERSQSRQMISRLRAWAEATIRNQPASEDSTD